MGVTHTRKLPSWGAPPAQTRGRDLRPLRGSRRDGPLPVQPQLLTDGANRAALGLDEEAVAALAGIGEARLSALSEPQSCHFGDKFFLFLIYFVEHHGVR